MARIDFTWVESIVYENVMYNQLYTYYQNCMATINFIWLELILHDSFM